MFGFHFQNTKEQWQTVFFISASFYVFGALIFLFCGSGDLQEWAVVYVEPDSADIIIVPDWPPASQIATLPRQASHPAPTPDAQALYGTLTRNPNSKLSGMDTLKLPERGKEGSSTSSRQSSLVDDKHSGSDVTTASPLNVDLSRPRERESGSPEKHHPHHPPKRSVSHQPQSSDISSSSSKRPRSPDPDKPELSRKTRHHSYPVKQRKAAHAPSRSKSSVGGKRPNVVASGGGTRRGEVSPVDTDKEDSGGTLSRKSSNKGSTDRDSGSDHTLSRKASDKTAHGENTLSRKPSDKVSHRVSTGSAPPNTNTAGRSKKKSSQTQPQNHKTEPSQVTSPKKNPRKSKKVHSGDVDNLYDTLDESTV